MKKPLDLQWESQGVQTVVSIGVVESLKGSCGRLWSGNTIMPITEHTHTHTHTFILVISAHMLLFMTTGERKIAKQT